MKPQREGETPITVGRETDTRLVDVMQMYSTTIETAVHGTFPWVDDDDIDGEDEDWPGPEDE